MKPSSGDPARTRGAALVATLLLLGCGNDGPAPFNPFLGDDACGLSRNGALHVPDCLLHRGVIDAADRDSSLRLFTAAQSKAQLFRSLRGTGNHERGGRISGSLTQVVDMHRRGLLDDSARFHRIMDVVSVAIEIAEDRPTLPKGKLQTSVTPFLYWYNYPKIGAYFQPVTTVQQVAHLLPRASVPLDSLLGIADQLYRYPVWRQHGALRFPIWEYEFAWTSGGIRLEAPWISGMAQGLVMSVFTEAYRRTQLPEWKTRAYEVLNSFKVTWSNGGVMLDDTTQGYWWEEFDPRVKVWNGSVQALVDVGFLWTVTQDTAVKRMFDRGIESLKYYTPDYDTGSWTLYSMTQGNNSVAYHNYHVALMDALYTQTSDPWIKTTADRWRNYQPPPGVH